MYLLSDRFELRETLYGTQFIRAQYFSLNGVLLCELLHRRRVGYDKATKIEESKALAVHHDIQKRHSQIQTFMKLVFFSSKG